MLRRGNSFMDGGGLHANPVQACAWLLAALGSGSSEINLNDCSHLSFACAVLDEGAQAMARSRAAVLIAEIRTAPTRPPPSPRERPFKGPRLRGR